MTPAHPARRAHRVARTARLAPARLLGTTGLILAVLTGLCSPGSALAPQPQPQSQSQPQSQPPPARASTRGHVHDPAQYASPDHCAAPSRVGSGDGLALVLDWPTGAVVPGTTQVLGVRVTNLAADPTGTPTQVVVHDFAPNRLSADPGLHPRTTATALSFELPAGLAPGSTTTAEVTVGLGPSIPPEATEHCSVTAAGDADGATGIRATAAYDVVTGPPVVHPTAAVLPLSARPGATTALQAVLGNAGPSNEHTGPAVYTFTAPERTRWASPYAYRCAPEPSAPGHPAGTVLRCSYPSAPLTWRDELEQLPLTVDADAVPGTTLAGGQVTATDPFAPAPFQGAGFDVTVTH